MQNLYIYEGSTVAKKESLTQYVTTPFPQTLVDYFQADVNKSSIRLKWLTTIEINSEFFTVERSLDSIHYEAIGMVRGSGNSSVELEYAFNDTTPLNGKAYYRLVNTDYHGKETFFTTVVTYVSNMTKNGMHIFPSISGNQGVIEVIMGVDSNEKVSISIVNLKGEAIDKGTVSGYFSTVSLGENALPGIYMVQANVGNIQKTKRLVIR
ncbi:T9SS type A sorting domain-containing protein [Fulvivirga sp. M361]|uniref:T9SS type A sorting domain-containing protein n=1 Tax=Fulvivirga sp. M361 TaxID=2594266 RepID=UPI00117B4636|nr:T9SS type A sorting domain-containing protein [Fulvivirga sp. M361]TRX55561.1 T9SS type A sorting domain-containing protein [Fulvivirga sp. M361]